MIAELYYRPAAAVRGHLPGHHRSVRGAGGVELRGHALLRDAPDARRLDLLQSLRDPFGEWRVRVYSERRSIPVVVVADLSASMGYVGAARRIDVVADLVASLAWSAWRSGDRFAFVGCDAAVRPDWLLPPTRARGAGAALAQALRGWAPAGRAARSADGLADAARHLGRRRALVFLVSDFHLPPALVARTLAALAAHEVVPVVLDDAQEATLGADGGIADVVDPEGGRARLVWWRPSLRAQQAQAHADQRAALRRLFAAHRLRPLVVDGAFDPDAFTRHFGR